MIYLTWYSSQKHLIFLRIGFHSSLTQRIKYSILDINKFLDYRNIHIVAPRNFGNSDHHESFDIEHVASDVIRYMWENQLSTATLAGHGYGGKVALAAGCYYPERSTGVFVVDSAPLDHRYHEAFRELREYVLKLDKVDLT